MELYKETINIEINFEVIIYLREENTNTKKTGRKPTASNEEILYSFILCTNLLKLTR